MQFVKYVWKSFIDSGHDLFKFIMDTLALWVVMMILLVFVGWVSYMDSKQPSQEHCTCTHQMSCVYSLTDN